MRRWDVVEREKDRARAERFLSGGPGSTLAASRALRARWQQIHGEPSDERRRLDFAHHVALKQKLEQVTLGLRTG
jgi:hypothetical protein